MRQAGQVVSRAHRRVRLGGRPRGPHEPRRRAREPPAAEDRPRGRAPLIQTVRARGFRIAPARPDEAAELPPPPVALAHGGGGVLSGRRGGFAGHWALARLVLGQLDAALVALAETEASALAADGRRPARIHEFAPGTALTLVRAPRPVRPDRRPGWQRPGSEREPRDGAPARRPRRMLVRAPSGEVVFETFDDFGEEPIRVAAMPIRGRRRRYAVEVSVLPRRRLPRHRTRADGCSSACPLAFSRGRP